MQEKGCKNVYNDDNRQQKQTIELFAKFSVIDYYTNSHFTQYFCKPIYKYNQESRKHLKAFRYVFSNNLGDKYRMQSERNYTNT